MRIATCSYRAYEPTMGTAVRISLGGPRQPEPSGRERWIYLSELAPQGWYLNAEPDTFTRHYLRQLDGVARDVEPQLAMLGELFRRPLILCCFEQQITGPESCHRRLFAEWWEARHPGISVPELDGNSGELPRI